MTTELPARKRDALARLKTVRGHLDGIIRMLEADTYCVDVMKQLSAAQAALEKTNRTLLRGHLETCFSQAVLDGRGQQAIDELTDAVKFDTALTGPAADLTETSPHEKHDQP
jgi:DNA-binding FrmR family transcriptional regulator